MIFLESLHENRRYQGDTTNPGQTFGGLYSLRQYNGCENTETGMTVFIFVTVFRGVYRGGFGSSLLPSGLRGGIKSPPEDFLKTTLIDFRQN